jgi:hypothetical protein
MMKLMKLKRLLSLAPASVPVQVCVVAKIYGDQPMSIIAGIICGLIFIVTAIKPLVL